MAGLAGNIQIAHSVFALPFALMTAFIVSEELPRLNLLAIGVAAVVLLRAFGLTANRVIDAEIDARNPRTRERPIPSKLVGRRVSVLFMALALALALGLCAVFEPRFWIVAPPLVAIIAFYPYLKRFTWLCHFGIGLIYFLTPIAVSLALTDAVSVGIVVLGVAAMLWVTGFDVLYGINDYEFDRANGIYSIPARFGVRRAIWATRAVHLFTALCLFLSGWLLDLGLIYYIGAGAATLMLLYENLLVSPNRLTNLNRAFFTMNGAIALTLCLFTVVDALVNL